MRTPTPQSDDIKNEGILLKLGGWGYEDRCLKRSLEDTHSPGTREALMGFCVSIFNFSTIRKSLAC